MRYILTFALLVLPLHLFSQETVYCIHGFMRTSVSMKKMASAFSKKGYKVCNWGYPSREKTIEGHAEALLADLKKTAKENPGEPIHFVTHSMGGLIVRAVHNLPDCPKEVQAGKAVLLSPPNQGTKLGRALNHSHFIRTIFGHAAGKELLTSPNFDSLGQFPRDKKVLIISGTLGWNPLIGERSDGKVGVTESCLPTPHLHKLHHFNHTWIMYSNRVIHDSLDFIAQ